MKNYVCMYVYCIQQLTLPKVLNGPNALIQSCTILVYNEMFSMVNIYNTNLATATAAYMTNSPGQIYAWGVANWTLTTTQFQEKWCNINLELET